MTGLPYEVRNVGTLSDNVTVYAKNATNFEKKLHSFILFSLHVTVESPTAAIDQHRE
jgi:hypothetical protein